MYIIRDFIPWGDIIKINTWSHIFSSSRNVCFIKGCTLSNGSNYRILAPFEDLYGKGWQLSHSLIAIGRGDFFGVGLGESIQKLQYLPEAHTDFVLAILSEELGLFGFTLIICLYILMIIRIFGISKISTQLRNNFSALLAQGIAIWFGIQAIINIGVNVGFFPTKGLTLPFVSYGGSALLVTFIASGILMRIDYENKIKAKKN